MADCFPELSEGDLTSLVDQKNSENYTKIIMKNKLSDQTLKQLLNSVIAKYHELSVSRKSSDLLR